MIAAEGRVTDDGYWFEVCADSGGWDWRVYRSPEDERPIGEGRRETRPQAMASAKMCIGQHRRYRP